MNRFLALALLMSPLMTEAQSALGEVVGTILAPNSNEPIVNARVYTESGGSKFGAKSDSKGWFRITAVPPGKYELTIVHDGDTMTGIATDISPDGIDNVGEVHFAGKHGKIITIGPLTAGGTKRSLLKYGVTPEIKFDREQITASPIKFDQSRMVVAMTSEARMSENGELSFRGSRMGDMIYMMDGIKMTKMMNVPSASINSMMVYTGGIPAKYGDTTGGVVVMESVGYFDLYRAWRAKESRKEQAAPVK